MARINTSKTLHNSYLDGDKYDLSFNSNAPMEVHPDISDRYDYAVTENQDLLMDRKDTLDIMYQIFNASPFNDGRFEVLQKESEYTPGYQNAIIKIPKDNISEVFNYFKAELIKLKRLSPSELIIAINEFFEFNYEYIYKKVLTPQAKQELLEDCYKNEGMQSRLSQGSSIKLF